MPGQGEVWTRSGVGREEYQGWLRPDGDIEGPDKGCQGPDAWVLGVPGEAGKLE